MAVFLKHHLTFCISGTLLIKCLILRNKLFAFTFLASSSSSWVRSAFFIICFACFWVRSANVRRNSSFSLRNTSIKTLANERLSLSKLNETHVFSSSSRSHKSDHNWAKRTPLSEMLNRESGNNSTRTFTLLADETSI